MTLDVASDIEQRLDRLAEATGYSKSLFYPELIRMGIDRAALDTRVFPASAGETPPQEGLF